MKLNRVIHSVLVVVFLASTIYSAQPVYSRGGELPPPFAKGRPVFYGDYHNDKWMGYYWKHVRAGRVAKNAEGPSPRGYHCANVRTDVVGVKFLIVTEAGLSITCTTADIVMKRHKQYNLDNNRVIEVPRWVLMGPLGLKGDVDEVVTIYKMN